MYTAGSSQICTYIYIYMFLYGSVVSEITKLLARVYTHTHTHHLMHIHTFHCVFLPPLTEALVADACSCCSYGRYSHVCMCIRYVRTALLRHKRGNRTAPVGRMHAEYPHLPSQQLKLHAINRGAYAGHDTHTYPVIDNSWLGLKMGGVDTRTKLHCAAATEAEDTRHF